MKGTLGTETSNYQEEKKVTTIPKVVASEIGRAQTKGSNTFGVTDSISPQRTIAEQCWKARQDRVKAP